VVVQLQLLVLVLHFCWPVGVSKVRAQGVRRRQYRINITCNSMIEAVIVLLSCLKRSNSPKTDQLNGDSSYTSTRDPDRSVPFRVLLDRSFAALYVQAVSSINFFEVQSGTMPNAEGRKVALITGM
jgi:hypothetical protein